MIDRPYIGLIFAICFLPPSSNAVGQSRTAVSSPPLVESRQADYWNQVRAEEAVASRPQRSAAPSGRQMYRGQLGSRTFGRSRDSQPRSPSAELNVRAPSGPSVAERSGEISHRSTGSRDSVSPSHRYRISPQISRRRFEGYRHPSAVDNARGRESHLGSHLHAGHPQREVAIDPVPAKFRTARMSDDLLSDSEEQLGVGASRDEDPFASARGGENDLLSGTPIAPHRTGANQDDEDDSEVEDANQVDPHLEVFSKSMYPSAKECGTCHEKIYREWSVSSHAYAAISPMFHKFEQTINDLSQGTIGYFCMRCHSPIGTDLGVSRAANIWDSIPAAREGVTCIACHRVVHRYGRVNGNRRIETGPITAPMVGAGDGAHLNDVLSRKDYYKVKTSEDEKGPGQVIHNGMIQFDHVAKSDFCVSCHQVAVYPGISLEVVWAQYRASPACKSGIRCQDCHMGAVPGKADGFETAPSAIVNGKEVNPHRRHSNHMFFGPGYSIAHPGTFPINKDADRWSHRDWLKFDWRAGWGTEEFEEKLGDDEAESPSRFPEPWRNIDDRYDAREIIDDNQELLALKKAMRFLLMENNSKVQGPFFSHPPRVNEALNFHYIVQNLSSGHNMPSGSLGAQPQLWLNCVLTGPTGEWLWESGYVDANGDIADMHSLEVAAGRIRRDKQLVNFQTKFLISHVKGPDREMYLPINVDFDQLPFIRPSGFPITTMNHPPFIRMEAHSLVPLGSRKTKYRVPKKVMCVPGRYRLSVRMRSRAEPIYFMRFCKATPEMERTMNERMLDFHQHSFEFIVR